MLFLLHLNLCIFSVSVYDYRIERLKNTVFINVNTDLEETSYYITSSSFSTKFFPSLYIINHVSNSFHITISHKLVRIHNKWTPHMVPWLT